MTFLLVLYHFARADFLERVRRYSFLVTLVLTLILACLAVPPIGARFSTVALGDIRGIYNTAWVSSALAMMSSAFLSLVGFYLTKNALERDKRTRVGQILAGTPTSSFTYLLGKALSNLLLLVTLLCVVMLTVVIMQFIRAEDTSVHFATLVAPFLIETFPFMAIVAALAVLFESLPILRSTGGNVIYFFVWTLMLVLSLDTSSVKEHIPVRASNDVAGVTTILHSMTEEAYAAYPDYNGNISMGVNLLDSAQSMRTFEWKGVAWTLPIMLGRFVWLALAALIVLLASIFFRPFRDLQPRQKSAKAAEEINHAAAIAAPAATALHLEPLPQSERSPFLAILIGELRLMYRSANRFWLIVALGLVIAEFFAPLEVGRRFLLPAAWIWPIALWSVMGCREKLSGTDQLIFSCPDVVRRQLPAIWIAGVLVALMTGLGVGVRFALAADWGGLASWVTGALFVPSVALVFGVVTGGRKLFEVIYTMVWYVGPLNALPGLDYAGATSESAALGMPIYFGLLAVIFVVISLMWRARQVRT